MAISAPAATRCDEATDRREQVRRALVVYRESRDAEALNDIVIAYQGLAYSLASRFAQRGEDIEDLNQVALIGLLKAVERFDLARGTELTTFATATILGELKRHLRDRGWWVRPPRRVHDMYISTQQAIDELTQRYGQVADDREVAAPHRCVHRRKWSRRSTPEACAPVRRWTPAGPLATTCTLPGSSA